MSNQTNVALLESDKLRAALKRIIERCEIFIDDEADMRTHSIEVLMGIAEDALSQQADPVEPVPAQRPTDAMLDELRRNGLSIDGDNAYKRDLIDTIIGAMAFGFQNTSPPPHGHWGQQFWDIGRAEAEAQEKLRSAIATRPARAEQQPEQGGWISVEDRLPEVAVGDESEFIVCVYRSHNRECYSFSARFLNNFPLHNDYEDEPALHSGWYDVREHADYDGWYSPLIEGQSGDKVTHWMPLPAAPALSVQGVSNE